MSNIEVVDVSLVGVEIDSPRGTKRQYRWEDVDVGQSMFVPFLSSDDDASRAIKRLRNALSWARGRGYVPEDHEFVFVAHPKKKPTGILAGRIA